GDINNRSLTCRMEYEGRIYGLISVNLPKHFAPLKEEQELVEEVAGDLAFALHKIRMEEKLQQTEQQYRLLAETATDIICIHDMEGNIRYLNPTGLNILGKTREEITGDNIHNYIDDPGELHNRKEDRLKGDNATYTYQTYIKNAEAQPIPVEIKSTPLQQEGEMEGILIIARDITERKQAEKALETAKNKAIESDRLKSTFLMNLSHEIRTPLNGIMGFSQILQEREFPFEKQKEFLNIIHEKADQLLNVLNNLLDLSKIEAGQLNIRQEDCYLNDLMYEIYDVYTLELEKQEKTDISLHYHCGLTREESRLYSDCSRISQILNNLLSNAIKFSEEGTIDFGYKFEEPHQLVFYIKDTGIGIHANKKNEIFEPFRQGDESTSREYEGTGLGLALSKSLVELLGGRIWLESEEGKGSTFYFTMPFSRHKYKPEEDQSGVSDYNYNWPGHKVLIVEDDPVSLEFMQEIFSETQVKILSAQTGKEALDHFRENPNISLILMDLRLPDMSGLEVVRKIRSKNTHAPIIAQTAYTMDNDAKKCLEAGCTDYLTKPVDIQAMLNAMNKHLRQSI
ncbi:MAG: response regulator, partial [Bacteroidales bacterium]|nr:response regulator [Bacteroidales bacterium]